MAAYSRSFARARRHSGRSCWSLLRSVGMAVGSSAAQRPPHVYVRRRDAHSLVGFSQLSLNAHSRPRGLKDWWPAVELELVWSTA
jgi:hypothetical protein